MALSFADFSSTETLYEVEGQVKVCKAFSLYHQRMVCLKILQLIENSTINSVLQETLVQASLDHENICKIYDCFVETVGTEKRAIVVMELMEKDLLTLIQDRRQRKDFWSEEELMSMFTTLIDVFEFLQSKNIAHRDIKPNNILVGPGGTLKVCDFGTSKRVIDRNILQSVKGTQMYMSPACKTGVRRSQTEILHDPYRSDVYSLGLTFLSMSKLVPPLELLVPNEKLVANTETTLNKLNYSKDVKKLLFLMLRPSEEDRPDFEQLRDIFRLGPALRTLNSDCEDQEALRKALSMLAGKPLKVDVSCMNPCSACGKRSIDLAGSCLDWVFCDCKQHVYCSDACYCDYERDISQSAVNWRQKAPCTRLVGSRPSTSVRSCLFCATPIDIPGRQVQLFCSPEEHVFCSAFCLQRFVSERSKGPYTTGNQISCPRCEKLIHEELLSDIYGSKEKYYRVIKHVCMKCNQKKLKFFTYCEHTFCKPCCLGFLREMKARCTDEIECPSCQNMLKKKDIKKAISVKSRFRSFFNYITS